MEYVEGVCVEHHRGGFGDVQKPFGLNDGAAVGSVTVSRVVREGFHGPKDAPDDHEGAGTVEGVAYDANVRGQRLGSDAAAVDNGDHSDDTDFDKCLENVGNSHQTAAGDAFSGPGWDSRRLTNTVAHQCQYGKAQQEVLKKDPAWVTDSVHGQIFHQSAQDIVLYCSVERRGSKEVDHLCDVQPNVLDAVR